MNPIDINEAQKRLFERHGEKIEMANYTKMNAVASFYCVMCQYKWEVTASGVIMSGTGCPECAKKKNFEKMRLDVGFIKNFIESYSCKWVGENYINVASKLLIKYDCGHIGYQSFDSFKNGHRCLLCSYDSRKKKQMKSLEEICKTVESYSFIFIGFDGEYINYQSSIIYKCKEGHITTRKFSVFRKNPNCAECESKRRSYRNNNSIQEVCNYVPSKNCQYISGEYVNSNSLLTIKFSCGHTQELPYYAFRNRASNLCYDCALIQKGENSRTPQEEFIKIVENEGFVFERFIKEYKGNTTKFEYSCKECGTPNIVSCAWFLKHKYCKNCHKKDWRDSRLGDKSASWKGGNGRLSLFFRRFINDWCVDSLKTTNYKCIITNNPAKTVHHLYPFYKIVEEFLLSKNISLKTTTKEFSSEELARLIDEFIPFHNSFGLGAPMTKKAHRLFHSVFSTINNTPQQFYEFKQRIASGEITIP